MSLPDLFLVCQMEETGTALARTLTHSLTEQSLASSFPAKQATEAPQCRTNVPGQAPNYFGMRGEEGGRSSSTEDVYNFLGPPTSLSLTLIGSNSSPPKAEVIDRCPGGGGDDEESPFLRRLARTQSRKSEAPTCEVELSFPTPHERARSQHSHISRCLARSVRINMFPASSLHRQIA